MKSRQTNRTREEGQQEGDRNRENRLREREEKKHWWSEEKAWVEMTIGEINTRVFLKTNK